MNKMQKRAAGGIVLAGTSLASIAGQAATDVSAGKCLSDYCTGKGVTIENKLSEKRESSEKRDFLTNFVLANAFAITVSARIIPSLTKKLKASWFPNFFLFRVGFVLPALTYLLSLYLAAETFTAATGFFQRFTLYKQYSLKKFEDMINNDESCSEFVRQLLVLERTTKKDDQPPYDYEVTEARETLQALFINNDTVDKIKDLKKYLSGDKRKALKVIKPLYDWSRGEMPLLFNIKYSQINDELRAKIALIKIALDEENDSFRKYDFRKDVKADEFIKFICQEGVVKEKPYEREYLKESFIFYTRKYLEDLGANNEFIDDSFLLDSAKSIFKDIDLGEDKCKEIGRLSSHDLAVKEFANKFEKIENKYLRNAVLESIESYVKFNIEHEFRLYHDRISEEYMRLKDRIKYVSSETRKDMLRKQYTIEEFEDMLNNDDSCSEFVRQLLVSTHIPLTYTFRRINKGEVKEARETLQALFVNNDSVDKIKDLKKYLAEDKEKALKVIEPLYVWSRGKVQLMFNQLDFEPSQKDNELRAKIALIKNALDDETENPTKDVKAEEFITFICHENVVKEKPYVYVREYLKDSFISYTREYLKKSGVNDESIDDSLLIDSAKSIFKDLHHFDILKLDEDEKKENVSSRRLAAREFYKKFKHEENLQKAVFESIENYFERYVQDYETTEYTNRDGRKESLKNRMEYVKNYLHKKEIAHQRGD